MLKKFLTIFAICLAVSGCASFSKRLATNEVLDAKSGYIYGRFSLVDRSSGMGHLRMAVGLQSTKEYSIQFDKEQPVSVIRVAPGTYNISKLIFATYDYIPTGEEPITEPKLTKPFTVEAGKAYYIGDYVGEVDIQQNGFEVTKLWNLNSIRDFYEGTTTEFRALFPLLQDLEMKRAKFIEDAQ
ncbi:MAG: hypothetical protein J0M22_01725 [Gammaproteobacteria bacterium]|nr:hypothetical protein [Gammaproteobacteria bacterium]